MSVALKKPSGCMNPASCTAPQTVENTLKQFYGYLQTTRDRLQRRSVGGHQPKQRNDSPEQRQPQAERRQGHDAETPQCHLDGETPENVYHALEHILSRDSLSVDDDDEDDDDTSPPSDNSSRIWRALMEPDPSDDDDDDDDDSHESSPSGSKTAKIGHWTDADTQEYRLRLNEFQETLRLQTERFPLHSKAGRNILHALYAAAVCDLPSNNKHHTHPGVAAINGRLGSHTIQHQLERHVQTMMQHVVKLLQEIQLVDLDKLIDWMQRNFKAGEEMEGKDVLLLCGADGSGKTTTLRYLTTGTILPLAADEQRLVDLDLDEDHYHYGRDNDNRAEGKVLNTARTRIFAGDRQEPQEIVICDAPGLSHESTLHSVEWDIANGLGMIRALHKAKTVRPVVVISREEVGSGRRCYTAIPDTVQAMTRMLSKHSMDKECTMKDLQSFQYVFTNYEEKHKKTLHQQLENLQKQSISVRNSRTTSIQHNQREISSKEFVFSQCLLDDMIGKTTPQANIVLPLQDSHQCFLQQLWNDALPVKKPRKFFIPFVSYAALKKLQLQLRITLSDLRTALVEEDQSTAVYRVQQLTRLAQVLPEASDCAGLARDAINEHMEDLRHRIIRAVRDRKDYSMAIHRSRQIMKLADIVPEAAKSGEFIRDSIEFLRDATAALHAQEYTKCQEHLAPLIKWAKAPYEYPEAKECASLALSDVVRHITEFRDQVAECVQKLVGLHGNKNFKAMLELLRKYMFQVIATEPLLTTCVSKQHGLVLGEKEVQTLRELSQSTGEAFCIDQVKTLTDHLQKVIPDLRLVKQNLEEFLKDKKKPFLAALERMKVASVVLHCSPAGAQTEKIYKAAFGAFSEFATELVQSAETKYKSLRTEMESFSKEAWVVAVLIQGPLKNKPNTSCRENEVIEELDRRLLKVMLRLEIEVTRAMECLKSYKFPEVPKFSVKPAPVPDLKVNDVKAPRHFLISIAQNDRLRRLLPGKFDALDINVCVAMFDRGLLGFWNKVVNRLEQHYAVIMSMQKLRRDPTEIDNVAQTLRDDVTKAQLELTLISRWSDDLANESAADRQRLVVLKDCVDLGRAKLSALILKKRRRFTVNMFNCGELYDSSDEPFTSRFSCNTRCAPE